MIHDLSHCASWNLQSHQKVECKLKKMRGMGRTVVHEKLIKQKKQNTKKRTKLHFASQLQ